MYWTTLWVSWGSNLFPRINRFLEITQYTEFYDSSNFRATEISDTSNFKINIFRLTWLIEKRELKVESENSTESISKILSNIDSALDNRNQNDTNKDSVSMEQMRSVFKSSLIGRLHSDI